MENQQNNSSNKVAWIVLIIIVSVIAVIVWNLGPMDNAEEIAKVMQEEKNGATNKQENNSQEVKKSPEAVVNLPKYEIVYEIKNKRYDGGANYYVLISPTDLTNDNFKNDVKNIVNQIVKEKGLKISIDFVDDKQVLDLEYKSHYGVNTLGRILTKQETDQLGLHLIATFSGELKTGAYLNEIMFFPATFKDNPKVGKYVESFEFNPNK
jgi:hypothetical protein